jgi:hypothetical protein
MQLYASQYIHFLYIITFLDSLLEVLQEFPTLKQIISLNIGLQRIISDYNQGHIMRELRTQGGGGSCSHGPLPMMLKPKDLRVFPFFSWMRLLWLCLGCW